MVAVYNRCNNRSFGIAVCLFLCLLLLLVLDALVVSIALYLQSDNLTILDLLWNYYLHKNSWCLTAKTLASDNLDEIQSDK